MPSNGEINAAIQAYNVVWDAAKDVDAKTAPAVRTEAMIAALCAADKVREEEAVAKDEIRREFLAQGD